MKIKVSEATPLQLDWMVLEAAGFFKGYTQFRSGKGFLKVYGVARSKHLHPSTEWSQGGPIIERESIYLWKPHGVNGPWSAMLEGWPAERVIHDDKPLIAAMRCYVASKLGDEVEVPEELQ